MSDKIECLKLALDINKLLHDYAVESIVKTAETLYAFVEAKPVVNQVGEPIDKVKPYIGKYPR